MDTNVADGGRFSPDPGPERVPTITLPQHGLTRYLRARLALAAAVLRWEVPRTFLGVVPIGVRHFEVPAEEIRSARITKVAHPIRLLVGAACIVVPSCSASGGLPRRW
jgi:hypothetical protein